MWFYLNKMSEHVAKELAKRFIDTMRLSDWDRFVAKLLADGCDTYVELCGILDAALLKQNQYSVCVNNIWFR